MQRGATLWILAALAASAAFAACRSETRRQILVAFFEDAAQNGDSGAQPVVRPPRRAQPPTPVATPTAVPRASADAAAFRTWEDVLRRLPKKRSGGPDWSRALAQEIIAPRPGIDVDATAREILDLDVELTGDAAAGLSVVFSHAAHTRWLSCDNCHPALFPADGSPIDGREIHGTARCGACHGTVAFEIAGSCTACHLRRLPHEGDDVDWNRALALGAIAPQPGRAATAESAPQLDLDVEFPSGAQPDFRALFSHSSHTQWLSCPNCHPRLFPESHGDLSGADLHARERCGACHGTVAFGQIGGCQRCHPVLQTTRHHHNSLDLDVALSDRPEVVFSHSVHTPWVECASCHSDLYAAAPAGAGAQAADFYEGRYCAQCHGDIARDLVARCQPCHAARDEK